MAINTSNLVSYWKADKAGEFKDSKGTNHGTINGATYTVDGKIGGGYSFDGNNDWVGTPIGAEVNYLFADSTTHWSVYNWFKYDGSDGVICGCAGGIGSATTFAFYIENNDLKCRVRGPSSNHLVKSNLDTSNFHFVCATWNGTEALVYYNDEPPVTIGIGTANIQEYNFGIADLKEGALDNFDRLGGIIDEVAIWDTALSASEVTELYNSGTGKTYNPETNEFIEDTFDSSPGDYSFINSGCSIESGVMFCEAVLNYNSAAYRPISISQDSDFTVTYEWKPIKNDAYRVGGFSLTDTAGYNAGTKQIDIEMYGSSGRFEIDGTNTSFDTNPILGNTYYVTIDFVSSSNTLSIEVEDSVGSIIGSIETSYTSINSLVYAQFYTREVGDLTTRESEHEFDNLIFYEAGDGSFIEASSLVNGQVSYWKFDGDATDEIGQNDGTNNGATYTSSGKINGAYSFDGSNDYINLGNDSSITTGLESGFTISLWVYPTNLGTIQRLIDNDYSDNSFFFLIRDNQKIRIAINKSNTWYEYTTSFTIPENQWTLLTWIFDGSDGTSKIYKNLTEESTTLISNPDFSANDVLIGRKGQSSEQFFNGLIDEPAIWNRALTQSEITALYNSGDGLQYPYEVLGPIGYSNSVNGVTTYTKINGVEATTIISFNGV